jgi:hypothetical protein
MLNVRILTLGPRANSSLYIYLSLPQLLAQDPPVPVFMSTNNVILTPGNADGVIPKELFAKVVRLRRDMSKPVVEKATEDTEAMTDVVTRQGEGEQAGVTQQKRPEESRETSLHRGNSMGKRGGGGSPSTAGLECTQMMLQATEID